MKKLILFGSLFVASVVSRAEMPYDSQVLVANSDNAYTVAVTNRGNDLLSVTSISAQLQYAYTGTGTVMFVRNGVATNLLHSIPMVNNSSFLITSDSTDGIWMKYMDIIKIFAGTNANVIVNRKETH